MGHVIWSQLIRRESKDVPTENVNKLIKNLLSEIDGFKQRDIYNVDESGFCSNLMPEKTRI